MGSVTYAALLAVLYFASASAELLQAIVKLQGPGYIGGNLTLSQNDNGPVTINGKVHGLAPGKHGFHIHEKGDITGGCGSTGAHYNPYKKSHGASMDVERHVGDLGNIDAGNDGIASISLTDNLISLSGANSVLGRAIVIHADPDDLGKGGKSDSLATGHAGARVACGVIGVLNPAGMWPSNSASTLGTSMLLLTTIIAFFLTK